MVNVLVPGGRYFDKETGEYILIENIADVITYVFEADGETDTWDSQDAVSFAENLVPANDIAITAERGVDVKIQKLNDDAIVPEYKTLGAAGFDIHITEDITVPANTVVVQYVGNGYDEADTFDLSDFEFSLSNDNHAVVGTGLAFEIPFGYELELRSRSGNVFKDIKIFAYNGTVDADFRGEVRILLTNLGKEAVTFKKGDRVAQGIIKRIEQVNFMEADKLSDTERGDGGFGHTGRK